MNGGPWQGRAVRQRRKVEGSTPSIRASSSVVNQPPSSKSSTGCTSMALISFFRSSRQGQLFAADTPLLPGGGCGGQGEECVAGGAPALPSPSQIGDGDDGAVVLVPGGGLLAAHPVPASGPQDTHGGRVTAGLGGEMAAVAEHVCPAAQRPEVLVPMGTKAQARGDQPPLVGARVGVDRGVPGGGGGR